MPDLDMDIKGDAKEPKKEKAPEPEVKKTASKKEKVVVFHFGAASFPTFGTYVKKEDGSTRFIMRPVVDHVLRLDLNDPDEKLVAEYTRRNAVDLRVTEMKGLDIVDDANAPLAERIDSLLAISDKRSLVQMLSKADKKANPNPSMGVLLVKLLELE